MHVVYLFFSVRFLNCLSVIGLDSAENCHNLLLQNPSKQAVLEIWGRKSVL